MTPDELQRKNRKVLTWCVASVVGMIGFAYASVPLYDLFCRVTGYGGTTQVSEAAPGEIVDRVITIRFDAQTNPQLPWAFYPEQRSMDIRVGETGLAFYRAESRTDTVTMGTATFNVTPQKAGQFFSKTQCFCFTEQALTPGQDIQMPVSFYVDPAIMDDPGLADVDTITLSYTFFRMGDDAIWEETEETAALDHSVAAN